MSDSKIPIGLELYSVREAFEQNPELTFKKISTMGYDGVEFFGNEYKLFPAERIQAALAENGLSCHGYLTSWSDMQPGKYDALLEWNRVLGNDRIAIGAAPAEMLRSRRGLREVIDHLNRMHETAKNLGFLFGYHNHGSDFVMVDGQTAWNHIFENTPRDFLMVLDTGNALEGGAHAIPILQKFPGRSPWVHIKPYSVGIKGHLTMIGEDSFDWPALLDACVTLGGAQVLTVEYGQRAQYTPFFGAQLCLERLKTYVKSSV